MNTDFVVDMGYIDKETISDISSLYGEHECIKAGRCKYTTQGLFLANAAFHKDKMSGDTDVHKNNLSGEIQILTRRTIFLQENHQ